MSEKPAKRRKTADLPASKPVKCTILLAVELHTKLAAAAAMRRMDRSSYAALLLREGLRDVVAFDRSIPRKPADNVEPDGGVIGGSDAA